MSMKNKNSKNDRLYFDEIADIQKMISQIEVQVNSQQKIIDDFAKQNKKINDFIDNLNLKLEKALEEEESKYKSEKDAVFNDEEEEEEEEEEERDMGEFDMSKEVVVFEGKKYRIEDEYLYCGNERLSKAHEIFSKRKIKDNYPQGVKYCESLFIQQKNRKEPLIIFKVRSPKPSTWFFFALNSIQDLFPTKGYRMYSKDQLSNEIANLTSEYKNDKFPQGVEYCQRILTEQLNKNKSIRILVRNNESKWTRYYFKTKFIKIIPNEEFRLINSQKKLNDELDEIQSNSVDDFPQGKDYCIQLIKNEIIQNNQPFVIKSYSSSKKQNILNYYPSSDIDIACNSDWWLPLDQNDLNKQLKQIDKRKATALYPQGVKYVKELLTTESRNGRMARCLVRNSTKDIWFILKI